MEKDFFRAIIIIFTSHTSILFSYFKRLQRQLSSMVHWLSLESKRSQNKNVPISVTDGTGGGIGTNLEQPSVKNFEQMLIWDQTFISNFSVKILRLPACICLIHETSMLLSSNALSHDFPYPSQRWEGTSIFRHLHAFLPTAGQHEALYSDTSPLSFQDQSFFQQFLSFKILPSHPISWILSAYL